MKPINEALESARQGWSVYQDVWHRAEAIANGGDADRLCAEIEALQEAAGGYALPVRDYRLTAKAWAGVIMRGGHMACRNLRGDTADNARAYAQMRYDQQFRAPFTLDDVEPVLARAEAA